MTKPDADPFSQAFYEQYKPVRNFIRRLGLNQAIADIWLYSAYLAGDIDLPPYFLGMHANGSPYDVRHYLHPWELALLAREVILHAAPTAGLVITNRDTLARAVNGIKDLSSFDPELDKLDSLLLHMHRLAHQQFPVQRGTRINDFMRYKLIFEHASVRGLFERAIGLSPVKFFFLGWAAAGALSSRPNFSTDADFSPFGITADERDLFYRRIVGPRDVIQSRIKESQRFGRSWAFTVNPLELTPLIALDPAQPHRVFGPIPAYVMRRITSGVYFDLVDAQGFDEGFGGAFDAYIGTVMRKCFSEEGPWSIHKPEPYKIGKMLHHGADWILSDDTANIFIECKAVRIRAAALSAETVEQIDDTVNRLVKMVVQNYSNINDAVDARSGWEPNALPTYNVVVTLEDFLPFGGIIAERLNERVTERLRARGMSEQLPDQIPYFIVSSAEFEGICSALKDVSIQKIFSQKADAEHSGWLFSTLLYNEYREAWSASRQLLMREFSEWGRQIDQMSERVKRGSAT